MDPDKCIIFHEITLSAARVIRAEARKHKNLLFPDNPVTRSGNCLFDPRKGEKQNQNRDIFNAVE
jgi:hypothetical protein